MNALAPVEAPALSNPEAEAALLGALMQSNPAIDRVADMLTDADFVEAAHGRIFSAIVREHSLGHAANPITLRNYFVDDEGLKDIGGPGYLAQLTGSGAHVVGIDGFAKQVLYLARRRRLIGALRDAIGSVSQADGTIDQAIADTETALADATDHQRDDDSTAGEAAARVIDAMHEDRHAGVRSGIEALDATMGAIQPKNLCIMAARPAMGKSSTAISYAIGAAKRGHGVLFISHEMSADEIAERALADMCFGSERRVPFNAITSGNISTDQARELARAQQALAELPITIIDVGSATIGSISRRVRRHKRRFAARGHKLELVIVDYLQLVRPDQREKDRYTAISEVSLGLKQLAKTHDIGLLALCQLSREVEKRHDKRPMLADLRDSGSIEQDADTVMFLLRPEYYLRKDEPNADDEAAYAAWQEKCSRFAGLIEFICAKRRRGSEGIGRGMFYGAYQAVR
ncbi:MAG: AAA family ATPase [Sphingomonas sp.]|nr:AAA family ATPase [Sphingomonas sp.]